MTLFSLFRFYELYQLLIIPRRICICVHYTRDTSNEHTKCLTRFTGAQRLSASDNLRCTLEDVLSLIPLFVSFRVLFHRCLPQLVFSTTRKRHLRTCFCTTASTTHPCTLSLRGFEKRVSVHGVHTRIRMCKVARVRACSLRTRGRRPHDDVDVDVDVDYASVSMVTVDVGPGPYAFNPTSMMMCGTEDREGLPRKGLAAGELRVRKASISPPCSPFRSLLPSLSLLFSFIYSALITNLRVAFSRSLSSLDKKS